MPRGRPKKNKEVKLKQETPTSAEPKKEAQDGQ